MSEYSRFETDLVRWTEAGLIEPAQADAIALEEATRGRPDRAEPRGVGGAMAEMLTYAGGLFALVGVGIFYRLDYLQMGAVGRLALPFLVALAALAAGILLGRQAPSPSLRRARAAALTLSVSALTLVVAQVQVELMGGPGVPMGQNDASRIGAVAFMLAAVGFAVLLRWTRAGLHGFGLALSSFVAVAFLLSSHEGLGPWTVELAWLGVGAVLVGAGELCRRMEGRWAAETLSLFGLAVPALAALVLAGDDHLPLEALAPALAVTGFGGAIRQASGGYALAAAIVLFATILNVEIRHFRDSLGFATILVSSGLALLGIAYLLARLLPATRRRSGVAA